jgi:superfamily II DNA/RNA helicase
MVISYDIAWGADKIVQRAGRVMRFWHEPRQVKLLFFTVDKDKNRLLGSVAARPSERLKKLEQRLNQSTNFTEIPILPEDAASYDSLKALSTLKIQEDELELDLREAPELSEVSSVLEDYTQLLKHRDTANGIPDDIVSAFDTDRVAHLTLVSVLQPVNGEPIRLVYDLENKTLKQRDDRILELFRCEPETKRADVSRAQIERARYDCVQEWLKQQSESPTPLSHICSVLLIPPGNKYVHSLLSLETLGFEKDE